MQQGALQDLETCWVSAESTSQRGDPTACLLYAQAAGETDIFTRTQYLSCHVYRDGAQVAR